MSRIRVYIKPFKDDGEYGDFIEVTDDVDINGVSSIRASIDSTEYDAGVFKFSNFTIKLANESGRYSDVDVFQSIFRTRRNDSIVRVTWDPNAFDDAVAGLHVLGENETTVFEGLLSDDATKLNLKDQKINFQCLGYESLLERTEVPFSSLSVGNTFEQIVKTCLDQAPFNTHITVSASNISCGTNLASDAIADLENQTVKEAMDEILIVSNSVLYIDSGVVYVTDRTPSATTQYTFYGQASDDGIENIANITNFRTGVNRVKNLLTWEDTNEAEFDQTSKDNYGVRKKQVSSGLITNATKKRTILSNFRDEFKNAKQELDLDSTLNIGRVKLSLLDKVEIDYPTVFVPADDGDLPLWGRVSWGNFRYPVGQWSATISTDTEWKVIQIKYNLTKGTLSYKLREV